MVGKGRFDIILLSASTVVCPLPFIFALDGFARESLDVGPQFFGFVVPFLGIFAYAIALTLFLLFRSFACGGDFPEDVGWARKSFLFVLCAGALYFGLGVELFHGQYAENTEFYLVSRFAPYFWTMVFALPIGALRPPVISSERRAFPKLALLLFPLLVVFVEKILFGRISALDARFAVGYVLLFTVFGAMAHKDKSKRRIK